MDLNLEDVLLWLHPAIAVTVIFPTIGMTVNFAWQTRQRRLQSADGGRSRIPSMVGPEHLKLGRFLAGGVVGLALLGCTRPLVANILEQHIWSSNPLQVALVMLMYLVCIGSLVMLYRIEPAKWRALFATLAGAGLVVISLQPGIFRRDYEWFISHYYFGISAALLMIFSLAIIQDIYQDRSYTWRRIHATVNCVALLLFFAQGLTGTRDLLEIPLSWQKPAIIQCNFDQTSPGYKTCPTTAPSLN